tara:strand:- start:212 stop:628 length:417 start_codon:yes stop_codon:yes gene_type:complete
MNILLVNKEDYTKVFPKIELYLEKAAQYTYGRFSANDIKNELLTKQQQLWIAFDNVDNYGFVVTEVIQYPKMKVLIMHFTAGKELVKWKDAMLSNLQNFAKFNDCKIIESYGRPGWAKVFKSDGYKQQFIFYELPVEN